MTDDENQSNDSGSPEGAEDDETAWGDIELTQEQRQAVLRSIQTPEMTNLLARYVQGGPASSALADVQRKITAQFATPLAEMAKTFNQSQFGIAEAAKSFATAQPKLADIADNFSRNVSLSVAQTGLASSLTIPALASNPAWIQSYGKVGIDSDIFKSYALVQPNLSNITARLVANADIGQGIASSALTNFVRSQTHWLESITETTARAFRAFYPPNLRDIDGITFELVQQVVMVDGIGLYGVPRKSVAEALIRAHGVGKRREVLGRRWDQISSDCRQFAERISGGRLNDYSVLLTVALDALDAGHSAAAQALAGTVIDTTLRRHLDKRHDYMPHPAGKRTTAKYDELSARLFIAFAPIWQAYQHFDTDKNDPIPTVFSRHASAHSVGRRQFNRRNAVQGLLLACGLLYRLDEQITTRAKTTRR